VDVADEMRELIMPVVRGHGAVSSYSDSKAARQPRWVHVYGAPIVRSPSKRKSWHLRERSTGNTPRARRLSALAPDMPRRRHLGRGAGAGLPSPQPPRKPKSPHRHAGSKFLLWLGDGTSPATAGSLRLSCAPARPCLRSPDTVRGPRCKYLEGWFAR
jgi:hypothetical protein